MIRLYNIADYNTDIKGYWLDNDKIYIDNIRIANIHTDIRLNIEKHFLFDTKKQEAVFYVKDGIAYIESKDGHIEVLKHKIVWQEKNISKDYIKILLLQHNGLTIYKNKNDYTIETWKA